MKNVDVGISDLCWLFCS